METEKGKTNIWKTANDLHEMLGTTRSWLRENWNAGRVRRRAITGHGHDGTIKTKYLYCVEDVERELEKTENGGEEYAD